MTKLGIFKHVFVFSIVTLLNTSLYAQPQAAAISVKTDEGKVLQDIHNGIWLVQFSQSMLKNVLNDLQEMNNLAACTYRHMRL